MSSNTKWLPFYVADYLGDTMHLTTLQHGAMLLLLMHYWRTGPLPADAAQLAAIAKLDDKAWKGVWPVLAPFFTANGDGALHQKRMDWELRRWGEISDKRREAGKRGAEAKHRPQSNGSGGAPPTPHKSQPEAVPKHIIPQPGSGNGVANATNPPVDNLAIATRLPDVCQPVSGNCHPFATRFATPHLHPQKNNILSLGEDTSARARREAPQEQKPAADLPSASLKEMLVESLRLADEAAAAAIPQRNHTLSVQRAEVTPTPRVKACYPTPAQLAILRKAAGIYPGAKP